MKRKKGKRNKFLVWIISVFLVIALIIIGFSAYLHQPADAASKYLLSKITGDSFQLQPPVDFLLEEIVKKDSLIDSLSQELGKYEKIKIHKRALVNVDSGTLNMRDKPSLVSQIVVRIPDNSFVDVLYFDTNIYYLNGQKGRWCKVKYADKEGWVWDGFITIQKE